MNYVPLEFMDAVVSTLRELCTTRGLGEELDIWKAAIDRQSSTRQVVDVFIACNSLPYTILKCVFRISSYSFTFEQFKAMDKAVMQIQHIFLKPPESTINSPITVSEIRRDILPLVNWAELQVDNQWTHKMSELMEALGEVEFSKICTEGTDRLKATITEEFMIKQLRGGLLKSCTAWPASSSAELRLAIEEFLITQPFQKVELPRYLVGDVEMIRRLFHSPCDAQKTIYWENSMWTDLSPLKLFEPALQTSVNVTQSSRNDSVELILSGLSIGTEIDVVWRREDNVEVRVQSPTRFARQSRTNSCLMSFRRL